MQQYLLHTFFQNISFYFSPFSRHGVTDSRGSRDERTGPFAFGTRIPYLRGPIGCRLLVGGFKKKSVSVWCIFSIPTRSMYGIFSYIWLICMVNAGKYTSPMDPMGLFFQISRRFSKNDQLLGGCGRYKVTSL